MRAQRLSSVGSGFFALLSIFFLFVSIGVKAEKSLTIASPAGEKTITLDEDPQVVISYDSNGMRLDFSNLAIKIVCIEDPSTTGLCRLQAYDGEGVSNTPSSPNAPNAPTGTAGDSSVRLSWSPPTDNGSPSIIGYRIQRANAGSSSFTTVRTTSDPSTEATISGLTNGSGYIFRVAAVNSNGVGPNSGQSAVLTPQASGDGGVYATACDGVSSSTIDCRKLFAGNISAGGSELSLGLTDNKVLAIPFEASTVAGLRNGLIQYRSFDIRPGYFFRIWLSYTPNGDILDGDQDGYCVDVGQTGEGTRRYSDLAVNQAFRCEIDSSKDLVWLNMEFRSPTTGDYAAYTIQTFTISGSD